VATIDLSFEISGIQELRELKDKLRNVEGVTDIERTTG
jgi:GTP pyrophosphokinase